MTSEQLIILIYIEADFSRKEISPLLIALTFECVEVIKLFRPSFY